MIHEIELTTVESLLVVEALRGFQFIHPDDKDITRRVVDKIIKSVTQDLKENQHGIDKNS